MTLEDVSLVMVSPRDQRPRNPWNNPRKMEGCMPWRQNLEISALQSYWVYALLTVLHLRFQDPKKGVPQGGVGAQNIDNGRQELGSGTSCRCRTRELWGVSSKPRAGIPLKVFCSHRTQPLNSGEQRPSPRPQYVIGFPHWVELMLALLDYNVLKSKSSWSRKRCYHGRKWCPQLN